MSAIIRHADERRTLLDYLRKHPDPQLRLRAHIILLLADGRPWAAIGIYLYCSSRTIARWKQRFAQGRVPALLGHAKGAPPRLAACWVAVIITWVTQVTPRACGFFRSRWSCELLALLLWQQHGLSVSRETVRRWLCQDGLVWRRPRPVLRRQDPDRAAILHGLRQLLLTVPDDETAVFQDEVDLNLNPKIGCMWMRQGQQAQVVTPGDNEKHYLAGSWHWRTGVLFTTAGDKRDGKLFVRHLEELCRRLRRYQKIHVICDNAKFHYDCWEVWEFFARNPDRVVLHFLPKYAPELNPIERVWWILHEQVTRCHQCQSLEELVDLVLGWLTDRRSFMVDTSA
jgi:putative transposase